MLILRFNYRHWLKGQCTVSWGEGLTLRKARWSWWWGVCARCWLDARRSFVTWASEDGEPRRGGNDLMQNKMSRDKCEHVCVRAYMLCCRCVCVCVCVRRDQLEVIWRATAPFSTSLPCSRYTLVFSAPRRAKNVPKQLAPHSYQGTAAFIIPTTTPTAQHSHTHSSHTQANFYPTLKYYRNTHTHTERTRNILFCLIMMIDADPPPPKKKKRSAAKQTVVGSINQLVGRGGTESPHWSSHRPNVSISKSFIPGTIFIQQHLPHWQGQRVEPATEQQRDRRGCRWCAAWSTWRCFTLSPWWLMGDGQVVRG